MARPALSADRAIDILNFLAARPRESFTLSELSRQLDINPTSAHAILATLTAASYVTRQAARKTYELGPALVAVGQAAGQRHHAVGLAHGELTSMADEFGLEALVTTLAGDELLVLARTGRPGSVDQLPAVGQRLPHVPPMGTLSVAWAGDDALEAWLGRLGSAVDDDDLDVVRRMVAATRTRGYEIGLESESRRAIGPLMGALARAPREEALLETVRDLLRGLSHEDTQLLALDPATTYRVSAIAAPVFGPGGHVVLSLHLLGFDEPLTGQQVRTYVGALLESARYITLTSEGAFPDGASPGLPG